MAIVAHRTESPTEQGGGGQRSRIYTKETVTSGRTRTDRLMGAAQDVMSVGGWERSFCEAMPSNQSQLEPAIERSLYIIK